MTRFKMKPGLAARIPITLSPSVFAKLKHAKRMTVAAAATAHDGAKHPHHKTKSFKLHLIYRAAGV